MRRHIQKCILIFSVGIIFGVYVKCYIKTNSAPTPSPTSIEREIELFHAGNADSYDLTQREKEVETSELNWTLESITLFCGQCGQVIPNDPNS